MQSCLTIKFCLALLGTSFYILMSLCYKPLRFLAIKPFHIKYSHWWMLVETFYKINLDCPLYKILIKCFYLVFHAGGSLIPCNFTFYFQPQGSEMKTYWLFIQTDFVNFKWCTFIKWNLILAYFKGDTYKSLSSFFSCIGDLSSCIEQQLGIVNLFFTSILTELINANLFILSLFHQTKITVGIFRSSRRECREKEIF